MLIARNRQYTVHLPSFMFGRVKTTGEEHTLEKDIISTFLTPANETKQQMGYIYQPLLANLSLSAI